MEEQVSRGSSASASPPIPPPSEIDLKAGTGDQFQCRICFETDGTGIIAPCKCNGTCKYVHRDCLDNWRAIKEGFAFSRCTTCKAPYYLRVHDHTDRKWRTLKLRFFVTRDILRMVAQAQFVISALVYLVHFIDGYLPYWLRTAWGSDNEFSFYDTRVIVLGLFTVVGIFIIGFVMLPLLFIMGVIMLGPFTVVGIFYSVLVATTVGQPFWHLHYHILAKPMLTKEYVVEDVDGEPTDWCPPPLPAEHVQKLSSLGLL